MPEGEGGRWLCFVRTMGPSKGKFRKVELVITMNCIKLQACEQRNADMRGVSRLFSCWHIVRPWHKLSTLEERVLSTGKTYERIILSEPLSKKKCKCIVKYIRLSLNFFWLEGNVSNLCKRIVTPDCSCEV